MSVRIQVVAVGRLKAPHAAAAELYATRVSERIGLRIDEVAQEPPGSDRGRASRVEGERLRARLLPRAWRVALEPGGRAPRSSEDLAEWLGRRIEAPRPLALLIGGADGLDRALVGECEERLSLGPLTLPHQLARVVLLEQVYRGLCILSGHPYPR